jgi:hypothetical protein
MVVTRSRSTSTPLPGFSSSNVDTDVADVADVAEHRLGVVAAAFWMSMESGEGFCFSGLLVVVDLGAALSVWRDSRCPCCFCCLG